MVPEYYVTMLTLHGTGVLSQCWLNMLPEYYVTELTLHRKQEYCHNVGSIWYLNIMSQS